MAVGTTGGCLNGRVRTDVVLKEKPLSESEINEDDNEMSLEAEKENEGIVSLQFWGC